MFTRSCHPPMLLQPYFSARPWGGDRLRSLLDKSPPQQGGPWGESWELSDHPDGPSRIASGPLAGAALGPTLRSHAGELLGLERLDEPFPLLIKFIDAAANLSVQVHPADDHALPLGQRGKCECWYVMACPEGAEVIHGLRSGVTVEELREAAVGGRIERLLRRVPIRPGDIVPVPPGTVHALMQGTLVCEVQQSSNLTYRLWDWDRMPARALHVDLACSVTRFDETAPPAIANLGDLAPGRWHGVVCNPYFMVQAGRWQPDAVVETELDNPHGIALSVVAGSAEWLDTEVAPHGLRMGQTWLVPAGVRRLPLRAGRDGLRLLASRSLELNGGAGVTHT